MHVFAPFPWPAAGILFYQGMINKISAFTPVHRYEGGTGLHSHLKSILVLVFNIFTCICVHFVFFIWHHHTLYLYVLKFFIQIFITGCALNVICLMKLSPKKD